MTEAEWMACADPTPMLEFLRGKATDRKLRLFAVACCRSHLQTMVDVRREKAVNVAELFADGFATEEELMTAHLGVDPIWGESEAFAAWASELPVQADAICEVQRSTWIDQPCVLRDIFSIPFHPGTIDPFWLTPNVKTLAQAIYEHRAFDCLPLLAEALEKAGCDNGEILSHCRGPGVHVRGCWALDLVLGKG